jgi:hypothetical protein
LGRSVYFVDRPQGTIVSDNAVADCLLFPTVARYCDSVRISVHRGIGRPELTGINFSARAIGLDQRHLTEILKKKHGNLAAYRSRAGGLPLWLIIYAEGWPAAARIIPVLWNDAVRHAREEIIRIAVQFDAAWLCSPGYRLAQIA